MAKQLFTNNAKSTLASALAIDGTSILLTTGTGALFGSPSGGDWQLATITDGTNVEIVKITARSTDTLTVTRAQEGTSARVWSSGAVIEGRITAGTLTVFPQFDNGGNARGTDAVNLQPGRTTAAAVASGTGGIAIGYDSVASGTKSVGVGYSAQGVGNNSVAMGDSSYADAYAVASGWGCQANGNSSVASGYNAVVNGAEGVAIGYAANVASAGVGGVSLGSDSDVLGVGGVAMGDTAQVKSTSDYGVAIGYQASVYADGCVAIGQAATVPGNSDNYAVAIGKSASAGDTGAIALGNAAVCNSVGSIAMGDGARAGVVAAWQSGTAYAINDVVTQVSDSSVHFLCIADGTSGGTEPTWVTDYNGTTTDNTVTWMHLAWTTYSPAHLTAIGVNSTVAGTYGAAIGGDTAAFGNGVAVGHKSAAGEGAVALGVMVKCYDYDSVAIGYLSGCEATTPGGGNVSIGPYSHTYADSKAIALGYGSINRISDTWNVTGGNVIRKDDDDYSAAEHQFFAGTRTVYFSEVVELDVQADDVATITVPTGATFYPDELGVIVTTASSATVAPNVSFGITGNTTALLGSTTATGCTTVKSRKKFTPSSESGVNSLTASVKTAATATDLKGRFYFVGILVEDQ